MPAIRIFDEPRDLISDHMAHAAHHEAGIHHRNGDAIAHDRPRTADDGLMHARRRLCLIQLLFITDELIFVLAFHQRIPFPERSLVQQLTDALTGADLHVTAAPRADIQRFLQFHIRDVLSAALTVLEHIIRDLLWFLRLALRVAEFLKDVQAILPFLK